MPDALERLGQDLPADKAAFGEAAVAEPSPVVQLQFAYNINTRLVNSFQNTGTVTHSTTYAVVASSANANAGATLFSRVPVKYNTGQGALFRGTAIFTTGVAGNTQLLGIGDSDDGFFFGYNGTSFGVMRRQGGSRHHETFTVTAGAGTAGGDITITLDDDATTVTVALNDTVREVAAKIAATDFSNTGNGWHAILHGDTVIFMSYIAIVRSGTFSFTDTDTTGVTATRAQTLAGVAPTDDWVAQTAWSEDKMDGSGASSMTLDPTKGNVYQIRFQWLGFGAIKFYVENSFTGAFQLVHLMQYANANTTTSITNPTLPICASSVNTTNTTDITVKTPSLAGFIEGEERGLGLNFAVESGTVTLTGGAEKPVVSIKTKHIYQSVHNRVRAKLDFVAAAGDGTKPISFRVYKNPVLTGASISWTDIDADNSIMQSDVGAGGFTGGDLLHVLEVGRTGGGDIPFHILDELVLPDDIILVTGESANNADVNVGINWKELF